MSSSGGSPQSSALIASPVKPVRTKPGLTELAVVPVADLSGQGPDERATLHGLLHKLYAARTHTPDKR